MASPGPSFLSCPPSQSHRYANASRDFRCKNGPPHCETFNNSNWIYIPPPYPVPCPPCPATQPSNSNFSPPTVHTPPYSLSYLTSQPSLPLTPPQTSYPPFPQLPQSSPYTVPPPPFPSHNQATFPPPLPNYPPPQQPSPSYTPPLPPPSYTPPPLPLSPPPVPPSPPPLPQSPPPAIPPLPPSPPTTPCNNDPQASFDHTEIEERKKYIQNRDENFKGRNVDNHHPQKIRNVKGKKRKSISSCDDDMYLPNKWKKIEDLIERLDNEEQKKLQSNCRIETSFTSKDHDRNKNSLHFRKDYSPKKNMSLYDLNKAKSMNHSTRRSSCDSHQRQRKDETYINCRKINDLLHVQEDYDDSKHKRRTSLDILLSGEEDTSEGYIRRKKAYFTQKDLDSNSRWKKVYDSLQLDDETKTNVDGSLQDLSEAYDSYYNLNDHQKVSYNGSYFKHDNYKKDLYENNKSCYKSNNYCTVKSEIHVVKNTKQNSSNSRERYNSINDSNFDTESIYSTDESDDETDRSSKKISNKRKYSKKNTRNKYELCEYKDKSLFSDINDGLDSDSSLSTTFDHSSNNSKNNLKYFGRSVYHVDSEAKSNEMRNPGYSEDELITKENDGEKSRLRQDIYNELDEQWRPMDTPPKNLNGKNIMKNDSNSPNDSKKYIESLNNIKNLNNDFICSSFIGILKYNNSNHQMLENNYKSDNEKILHNNHKNILKEDTDIRKEIFVLKGNWSLKSENNNSGVNILKNKSSSTHGKVDEKDILENSEQNNHILDLENLDLLNSNDCSNIEIYPYQVEKFNNDSFLKKLPNHYPEYSNDINKSHSKDRDDSEIFGSPNKSFCGNIESNDTNRTETNDSDNKNHRTNVNDINQYHSNNLIEETNTSNHYKIYSITLPHIGRDINDNTNSKSDCSQVNMSNNAEVKKNLPYDCQLENENEKCYLSETRFPNNKKHDLMNKEEIIPQNDGLDSTGQIDKCEYLNEQILEIRESNCFCDDTKIKSSEIFENTKKEISSIGETNIEGKLSNLGSKSLPTNENYSLENKTTDKAVNDINYNINMKKHNKENISNKVEKVESPLNQIFEQIETSLSYNCSKKLSKDIFKLGTGQNSFRSENSFLVLNEIIEKNISNLNADHDTNINNKEFSCTKCKRKFSTPGGLKEHLLYHKGGTFECVKCGEKFWKLIDMTTHIKDHIDTTYPTDAVCSHVKEDDNNILENEDSSKSNENYKSVNKEHEKSVNDSHSKHDSDSDKYGNSESNHHKKSLSSMKLPSKKRKTKYYRCSYCDYKSKRERFLSRHLQKHIDDRTRETSQLSGEEKDLLVKS